MSKVLMLSYWNVSDPAFGGGRRINALIQALNGNVVLCQPGSPHPACETITYTVDFGKKKRGINWGMFNFLWPASSGLVRSLVAERKPPVIIMTSMWNYFPLRHVKGIPIVLDAHDVNAIAVGERLGTNHPFTRMVRAWEARVVTQVDHLFACSTKDRDQFIALYGVQPKRVSVAPNGVNLVTPNSGGETAAVDPALESKFGNATVLFFMGKLNYQPNVVALNFLNTKLMPELERRHPGRFRLLVCGGPVPPGSLHPSIVLTGVLSSAKLQGCLRRADICLAPIFTGSGTRLKVLEFMAAGKPVIATPKGAEELGCESGRDLIIAEPKVFADQIAAMADDPARARAIAAAGYDFVKAHFSWATCSQPVWREVIGRWLPLS